MVTEESLGLSGTRWLVGSSRLEPSPGTGIILHIRSSNTGQPIRDHRDLRRFALVSRGSKARRFAYNLRLPRSPARLHADIRPHRLGGSAALCNLWFVQISEFKLSALRSCSVLEQDSSGVFAVPNAAASSRSLTRCAFERRFRADSFL
jgi:hypothetical protein